MQQNPKVTDSFSAPFLDKVCLAIEKFNMLMAKKSVLVAFSGGKDSVALLHALKKCEEKLGIKLYAMHVNHSIRKSEADSDEQFCKDFCEKNDIPFFSKKVDAVSFSKQNNMSLEEGARVLRYEALSECAEQNAIDCIATAHSANDNGETVLFNLIRGTSVSGLKGIPPTRSNIIRPLLLCKTQEIYEYCDIMGLKFVYDSTNSDTNYTRNKIRSGLYEEIKEINPNFETAISHLTESARRDCDYLDNEADKYREVDDCLTLSGLHPAILTRVIKLKYDNVAKTGQLDFVQTESIMNLIKSYANSSDKSIKSLDLSGNITFKIENNIISFANKEASATENTLPTTILADGFNKISENCAVLLCKSAETLNNLYANYKNVYKNSIHIKVKTAAISGKITVRSKTDGDVIYRNGMTKKLKKLFNEAKLPLSERSVSPVFVDEGGVLWAVGLLRDLATPQTDDKTTHIIYLSQNGSEIASLQKQEERPI